MVFKVLLVAALLAFVLGDDNVLQFVRSKPEWKFSLNSLLAEDVHLTLYDSVNCTGSDIGNLQCDGKTCQDLARLKSVKIVGSSRFIGFDVFRGQGCQNKIGRQEYVGGQCYGVLQPSVSITCSV